MDPKACYEKNNQLNNNVHNIHFTNRKSYKDKIYNSVLRKRFLNKTKFYTYLTTPSLCYMINFKKSSELVDNPKKYIPYIACPKISADNTIKLLDKNQIIHPGPRRNKYYLFRDSCCLKHKQLSISDPGIKAITDVKDKHKSPIEIYNKTFKCAPRDYKKATNKIVLISNHSVIGLKNDKRSNHLFNRKINENRKPFLPTMEINPGKTKTYTRKYCTYLKTDSAKLNIIYSDYPEILKNISPINFQKSSSYLKTRSVGVDTSTFVRIGKNYMSSRKKRKTIFKQIKLSNHQCGDENMNNNAESMIEYTDDNFLESKQRYKSRRNCKLELIEKCETLSQLKRSKDTSTSFGRFDIKEKCKVKLKAINSLNTDRKEVGGIINNLKKFYKGPLKCKSEDTSIEPESNKAKPSQILHFMSLSSLPKEAFEIQRSSSNRYCYSEEVLPHKLKITKEIGTNVLLATIPQRRKYKPYYYKKFVDKTYTKVNLTPKVDIKFVELQPCTKISSLILENPICYDGFINNMGRRWNKYKTCQIIKIRSSTTRRSSSFTHKYERRQKSFQQQVKRSKNHRNKNALKKFDGINDNKMSATVFSNLYPGVHCVRSSEIRRCDDFGIFEARSRSTRRHRILRVGYPRSKSESKENIVQPLEPKLHNQIKNHMLADKNVSTSQTQPYLGYYKKCKNDKYFQQNKVKKEISSFLESNVNDNVAELMESNTNRFEKCIVECINSFQNIVHKIKKTGLLRIGNINKIVSKDINKMNKTLWHKKKSANKTTNKFFRSSGIRSSKSAICKNKVHMQDGNTLVEFSANHQDNLFLTEKVALKLVMDKENESIKNIILNSSVENFDLREINNGRDIETGRVNTYCNTAYCNVNKKDKSENDSTNHMDMNIDAVDTKICSLNNVRKQIDGKKKHVYGDAENANAKINKKKNKIIGSYRFPLNKFCHIGDKFTEMKIISSGQKIKNIKNNQANPSISDHDKKIKSHEFLWKQKPEVLNEKENKLQETQIITMCGTETSKDNKYFNEKCISSINKHGNNLKQSGITKDNQKKDVRRGGIKKNSVNRIQNPQKSFTKSQHHASSNKVASLKSSCKTQRIVHLKEVYKMTKRKINLIGHLVLVEYIKPKTPLIYRDRLLKLHKQKCN